MSDSTSKEMKRPAESHFPYQNLFIYYLKGTVDPDQIKDEVFIGNWEEEGYAFLFFSQPSETLVSSLVAAQPQLTLLDQYEMTYEQWQGGRLTSFKVGEFNIVPPWQAHDPDGETRTVYLDPGVVFGNGLHPTTRDCLLALTHAWEKAPAETVLDLGTGTGILAVAAACIGGQKVLAADVNLLAVLTAARNIRLNRQEHRVLAIQGDARDIIAMPADLIIANIHYDVLAKMIAAASFKAGQRFILSGLLKSQAADVRYQLDLKAMQIEKEWLHEGIWHTFYGMAT